MAERIGIDSYAPPAVKELNDDNLAIIFQV